VFCLRSSLLENSKIVDDQTDVECLLGPGDLSRIASGSVNAKNETKER
jgi:hypothetical protein